MYRKKLLSGAIAAVSSDLDSQLDLQSDSVSEVEREYCYYVEIGDFSQLRSLASKILDQEQWNFPTNGKGTLRMRKEVEIHLDYEENVANPVGEVIFEQTLKVWRDSAYTGVSNSDEVTFKVDELAFNTFKKLCESGMIKRRFEIPFELVSKKGEESVKIPAKLEVDVFFDSEGHYQPWAKVDVETKAVLNKAPAFPFTVGEIIEPTAEKSVRDKILNTYFLTKV